MAEIINLNHFRKARQKADKETQAARNRVRHGRRKDERQRLELEDKRRERELDDRRLRDDELDGDQCRRDETVDTAYPFQSHVLLPGCGVVRTLPFQDISHATVAMTSRAPAASG